MARVGKMTSWAAVPLLGAVLAAAAIAVTAAGALAANVTVQLTPATVTAGNTVYVRAFCGSGTSATVTSSAFSSATLGPASSGGGLIALVSVPSSTSPAAYVVHVSCANGDAGDATLTVAPAGGAGTGDGTTARQPNLTLLITGLVLVAAAVVASAVFTLRGRPRA